MTERSAGLETLLIGLDAACLSVLEPLFEEERLPHLQELFEEGASGPLTSHIPPWTPSAWTSLTTGKNPGKHGIFDFLTYDGYDWSVVNASHVREPTLWEILSWNGLTSVVVNVPVTHPPTEFDGALVPGYVGPEDPDCHPKGLMDDLESAIGEYRVYPREPDPHEDVAGPYVEAVEMRRDAFVYLVDRFEPAFGFVQFQQTDTIFHDYPGDTALVRSVYEAVDAAIGAILDDTQPNTVFVVSDHGIGPYEGYEFRINDFLANEGYLDLEHGGRGMPNWGTIRENTLVKGVREDGTDPGLLGRAVAQAARFGLTAQRVAGILDTVGLAEPIGRRIPNDVIFSGSTQVDFPNSRAYMRTSSELGVRINLEGREPAGSVPKREYESFRRDLIDKLRAVRTPDGDPVFEAVVPRESNFHGPQIEDGPDIVLVPDGFDTFVSERVTGSVWGTPREPWNHKREGIFGAMGAAVDTSAGVEGAHLYDVAPTVLAACGVPTGERMDGEVLACVEPTATRVYPRHRPSTHARTDPDVEQRLADVGYL